MSKKRKKIIKKVNSFKKQLKTNLSLLKTHIYNYKLEILLSVLIIVVIFLIALIYPSSYILLDDNNNSFNDEVSKNTDTNNVGQSIDEYLADVLKDDGDNDDENYNIEDFREEKGVNDNSESDNNETNDSTFNDNIDEDLDNLEPEPEEDNNNLSNAFINSFGDSFTSSVYLNLDETNMYLDDISTALTFKPLYDFSQVGSCGGNGSSCDFKKDLRILDYGMEACIKGSSDCLKVINDSLYYNGTELELPEKLRNKELMSLTVGALES
jgi:hypothetical protein